jgi:hypothetical protein
MARRILGKRAHFSKKKFDQDFENSRIFVEQISKKRMLGKSLNSLRLAPIAPSE